jgi:hypothetical protein
MATHTAWVHVPLCTRVIVKCMRRVAVHACGVITVLTVQSLTFAFALLHLFTAFAYFA